MDTIILFSFKGNDILSNINLRYKSHLTDENVIQIKNILKENNYNFDFDICRYKTGIIRPFMVVHDLNLEVMDFMKFCEKSGINELLDSSEE